MMSCGGIGRKRGNRRKAWGMSVCVCAGAAASGARRPKEFERGHWQNGARAGQQMGRRGVWIRSEVLGKGGRGGREGGEDARRLAGTSIGSR
eukprot:2215717-Pleurochrysis_carterae.AAC.1